MSATLYNKRMSDNFIVYLSPGSKLLTIFTTFKRLPRTV